MLSVTVHKDIAEYQPKVVGKMTGRTLISIVGALGVSVLTGVYLYFVLGLNPGDYMMVIYIHGAHTVRPIAFRLRTGALGETFPRHDVGAVDDHVDRVPVGVVLLTVLLVQGEHDLLVRVIPAGVLLGEPHAILGREPAAVYIALIGKERQHLMIEDRVLRLDDLAGLLVPTLPRGLVVTVPVAGTRHEGRPLFQIMASGHVLLVTEKNFFIIVDVVAQMLLMAPVCHTLLFDDRHSAAPPFKNQRLSSSSGGWMMRMPPRSASRSNAAMASPMRKIMPPIFSMSCFAASRLYASPP